MEADPTMMMTTTRSQQQQAQQQRKELDRQQTEKDVKENPSSVATGESGSTSSLLTAASVASQLKHEQQEQQQQKMKSRPAAPTEETTMASSSSSCSAPFLDGDVALEDMIPSLKTLLSPQKEKSLAEIDSNDQLEGEGIIENKTKTIATEDMDHGILPTTQEALQMWQHELWNDDDDDDDGKEEENDDNNGNNQKSRAKEQQRPLLHIDTGKSARSSSNDDSAERRRRLSFQFVRKGTRLKNFIDEAMQQVKCAPRLEGSDEDRHQRRQQQEQGDLLSSPICMDFSNISPKKRHRQTLSIGNSSRDGRESPTQKAKTNFDTTDNCNNNINGRMEHYMSDMGRKNVMEKIQLQQQLDQSQSRVSTLEATNTTLREEVEDSNGRWDRAQTALRMAGQNASKARDDAESAEATAATLAQSLESMQSMVTKTKHASHVLRQEHQQIHNAVVGVEGQVLQKETDLARAEKRIYALKQHALQLASSEKAWKKAQQTLQIKVEEQAQKLREKEQLLKEREAIENARKERAEKLEEQWRQSQELLVQATSAAEAAEQGTSEMKKTVGQLRLSNEYLSEQLTEQQQAAQKETKRLQESLASAEQTSQQLKIRAETVEENSSRLLQEKELLQKQLEQIKKSRRTSFESTASLAKVSPPSLPLSRNNEKQHDDDCDDSIATNASVSTIDGNMSRRRNMNVCSLSHPGFPAPVISRTSYGERVQIHGTRTRAVHQVGKSSTSQQNH